MSEMCEMCDNTREVRLKKPAFGYFWCGCRYHGRCPTCSSFWFRWIEAIYLAWRTLRGNPP